MARATLKVFMKNAIILILTATTITLGVVCVMQSQKSNTQQMQMAALRGEVQAQSQQIEDLQVAQKRSEGQRRVLMNQAEQLAAQLQARQVEEANVVAPAPSNPPPVAVAEKSDDEKGGFGKMLSKMLQNPETRQFMREQQRLMVDQMYAPLIKQMGLTPEEASQFKDMLADNTVKAADKASAVFGGGDSTNRAASLNTLNADQKSFDEQLKAFLGDARYAQYKDYQETVHERTLLNQFKMQAGSDYNLTDPQTEALLTFMKEEQKSVAKSTGLPLSDADKDPAKVQEMFSDGKVDQILQAQETIGQRVYERARTILSPEQLDTLARYQTNRMQMFRMGIGMMKSMFGSDKPSPAGTPPSQ